MHKWQLLPVAVKANTPLFLKKYIFIIFSNPIKNTNSANRNMDLNSSSPIYYVTDDKLPSLSMFSFSHLKKGISVPDTEVVIMIK